MGDTHWFLRGSSVENLFVVRAHKTDFNAFTSGKPVFGDILLGISIWRILWALKGPNKTKMTVRRLITHATIEGAP